MLPTRNVELTDQGFDVTLFSNGSVEDGPACLSFEAQEADPPGVGADFLGVFDHGRKPSMRVERVLPANYRATAYRQDPTAHLFQPRRIQDHLLHRLTGELSRRGAPMPEIRGLDAARWR